MHGTITIHVTGLRNDRGVARIALFGPDMSHHTAEAPITGQQAIFTFTDLPHGRYAASAFHDEDGDGQLDADERAAGLNQSHITLDRDAVTATLDMGD